MKIAIFGATSQIAKDVVLGFSKEAKHALQLFGRRPDAIEQWLSKIGLKGCYNSTDFSLFDANRHYDAIINFVGSGNPAQTAIMGEKIFDATLKFDEIVLGYLARHPDCRYIFLSSGAAYGSNFENPVDGNSKALVQINNLQPQDWYAVAKLYAECRHRALPHLHIVDIRVFNYFSHSQDVSARFFITDIIRAIKSGETLISSAENIIRDFIGPEDFFQLINKILTAPPTNNVVDCYTSAPVDKFTLLASMQESFNLKYELQDIVTGVNATGTKINYFSMNKRAENFGYSPTISSLDSVLNQSDLILHL
ncbi:NAD-dependent epimerase/dehydratase family protein [Acidithiobacillus sp. HP-11]|uniref:NAD-dependent epimerase/dehydratase family protein n=1 Tax=Acidithiobacillus sp. HP-11 TaxID=2697656 RepID=UPI001879C185|nr:NAD(P)-dependent oxidoreductase [Acidithiobacillus sp. HP-11]MBE7565745.1 NAD(P)-dependent oxidoreductase [Acidithiobacillus sp. HP-11]